MTDELNLAKSGGCSLQEHPVARLPSNVNVFEPKQSSNLSLEKGDTPKFQPQNRLYLKMITMGTEGAVMKGDTFF